jgi:hypothetical protein
MFGVLIYCENKKIAVAGFVEDPEFIEGNQRPSGYELSLTVSLTY